MSDLDVRTPNATSTSIHMDQMSFNVEDVQSLDTSPLINSSFASDIEI